MKKIPSMFDRDWAGDKTRVLDVPTSGCEWVVAGEGIATRKYDGTACLVRTGRIYARYDAKGGKPPPEGFEPAQEPDPKSGHWPGWLLVTDQPQFKYHLEALVAREGIPDDGTYELCGPKMNCNPEKYERHILLRHGGMILVNVPRTYDGLTAYLSEFVMEGVVFHHPDGRMAKVKSRDLGISWPRV